MSIGLIIDESGDTGLENVISWFKPGKGPHHLFIFGAYLLQTDKADDIRKVITDLEAVCKKSSLHFRDLDHSRRVLCAQGLATAPITAFGLISDKNQLADYKEKAKKPEFFFNKNVHYLFEAVDRCGYFVSAIDGNFFQIRAGNFWKRYLFRFLACGNSGPVAQWWSRDLMLAADLFERYVGNVEVGGHFGYRL